MNAERLWLAVIDSLFAYITILLSMIGIIIVSLFVSVFTILLFISAVIYKFIIDPIARGLFR